MTTDQIQQLPTGHPLLNDLTYNRFLYYRINYLLLLLKYKITFLEESSNPNVRDKIHSLT